MADISTFGCPKRTRDKTSAPFVSGFRPGGRRTTVPTSSFNGRVADGHPGHGAQLCHVTHALAEVLDERLSPQQQQWRRSRALFVAKALKTPEKENHAETIPKAA